MLSKSSFSPTYSPFFSVCFWYYDFYGPHQHTHTQTCARACVHPLSNLNMLPNTVQFPQPYNTIPLKWTHGETERERVYECVCVCVCVSIHPCVSSSPSISTVLRHPQAPQTSVRSSGLYLAGDPDLIPALPPATAHTQTYINPQQYSQRRRRENRIQFQRPLQRK